MQLVPNAIIKLRQKNKIYIPSTQSGHQLIPFSTLEPVNSIKVGSLTLKSFMNLIKFS